MQVLRDLRYALLQAIRRPGFTAVAVLTLGLGVGLNTTVFSAVYAVLLAKPPYPAAGELRLVTQDVVATDGSADTQRDWSYPEYERLRDSVRDMDVAAYTPYALSYNLATADEPAPARVEFVSASYFPVLGVPASQGRTFAPDEDLTPGTHPVAIIGYGLWQSAFGGVAGIVGQTITINGVSLNLVGVMPAGFAGLSGEADVWVPMMMAPDLIFRNRLEQRRAFWHSVIARVPARRASSAAVELESAAATISREFASSFGVADIELGTLPLTEVRIDRPFGRVLLILLAAVGCVLLIACANLANLLLARDVRRARELGLRLALGASARRLLGQYLAEATVLSILGGAAAILVAIWAFELVRVLDPGVLSAPGTREAFGLSLPVLAFNLLVAVLAAFTFFLLPAFAAMRSDPRSLLNGVSPIRRRAGPRRVLVVGQVAVATVLLIAAGLLLRSLDGLEATPLGFRPDRVFAAFVNVPSQSYSNEEEVLLFTEAVRRIEASRSVEQAAIARCLPVNPSDGQMAGRLTGECDEVGMRIQDEPVSQSLEHDVWMNMVAPAYFSTVGIPVVEGRAFTPDDQAGAPRVAIVTRSAANRYWPGRDPIGAHILLSTGPEESAEVVGVVGDTMGSNLRASPEPGVYLSYLQFSYRSNYLVVRSRGDPLSTGGLVRSVLRELDSSLPLWDVGTLRERVNRATARDRFGTALLGSFALLALLLAALGIFGVLAFLVEQRRRDVGIRMAVGATSRDVSTLALREGLSSALTGVGLGLVLASALTRVLESQLFDVSPLDPLTFIVVAIVLVSVAGIACVLPSWRASRMDPMVALRHE